MSSIWIAPDLHLSASMSAFSWFYLDRLLQLKICRILNSRNCKTKLLICTLWFISATFAQQKGCLWSIIGSNEWLMDSACGLFAISSRWFQLVCPMSWERAESRFTAPSAKKFTRRHPSALTSMELSSVLRCPICSFKNLGARSCCLPYSRSTSRRCVVLKSLGNVAASFSYLVRRTYSKRRSASVVCAPECLRASLRAESQARTRSDKKTWTKPIIVEVVRIAETSKVSSQTILRSCID